jgi:hypothetical protein
MTGITAEHNTTKTINQPNKIYTAASSVEKLLPERTLNRKTESKKVNDFLYHIRTNRALSWLIIMK